MVEGAPLKVIWIFTCNGRGSDGTNLPDTFEPRFLSRNLVVAFQKCNGELPGFLKAIWDRETAAVIPAQAGINSGHTPDFDKMAQTAEGQVRDALQALEVAVMTQSYSEPEPTALKVATPPDSESVKAKEAELRKLWDENGVPKELQDSILADVAAKAEPDYGVGPWPPDLPAKLRQRHQDARRRACKGNGRIRFMKAAEAKTLGPGWTRKGVTSNGKWVMVDGR